MYNGVKVLDIHGHMTTPPGFRAYLAATVASNSPGRGPNLSDEQLDAAVTKNHLAVMDDHNIDVQVLGPRPIAMYHWMRPFLQHHWARVTNDVIAQTIRLHPDRFLGMAQLPQSSVEDTSHVIPELERCVKEYGFVGAYLNPDPAGDKQTPGVNDPYWYPLYEKAQELGIVLMVHPSTGYDRRVEVLAANYQINNVTEEYIANQLLTRTDVFKRFPEMKVIVCHCGGSLDRFIKTDKHLGQSDLSKNLFYDTCAYDETFLEAAIKQRGVDQMCFGTEAPGSGGAVRPETGKSSDDMVPVVASLPSLSEEDKVKIFNTNPKKVFPQLEKM